MAYGLRLTMPDDYSIHLNFFPVIGDIPAFRVYRKLRDDLTLPRPEGLDVQGYSLPRDAPNRDDRWHYWVGFTQLDGYEEFPVEPDANNNLTQWAMFKALCETASRQLNPPQLWILERGFLREVHFPMRSYPEGEQELVVQPYWLKAVQKFGLVADFHFRLRKGVPFSRRVQQLSLSLDEGFSRNLNCYVDRVMKISKFVRERRTVLTSVKLPGAHRALEIDSDFQAIGANRLRSRVYVFGGGKESRSQFTGLRDFGPLKRVETPPRLLFVFREKDRQAARTLAIALRGHKERFSFPGFEALFRTAVEIDSNPIVIPDFSRVSMELALDRVRREPDTIIPILVMPDNETAGYLNHKAVFAHAGIATQVCTLGVIQDERMLKWATANIALQVFCKAGGFPWKVRPTSDRSLIIGISQSHKVRVVNGHSVVEKHFAFSILTDSSGLFQKIQVLGEAVQESDYLVQLRENLRELLMANAAQFSRVVIHTSFKLKYREIDAIHKVAQDASADMGTANTRFAVVKVNHTTRFFGANRGVNSLVPFEGTSVKLGPSEYLVWFEGIFPDKLTVTKAFPGPTHLEFLRVSDEKHVSEEVLLQELSDLSGANWRGFNAKSAPVSVFYCHLVADLVHDFHERGLPLPAVEGLRPWFL
jgi:Piwi domain